MAVRWLTIPVMILVSLPVQAHKGDRIVPIFEITDEQLKLIDIGDGGIDDWEDLGEPSLTILDFSRFSFPGGENPDIDVSDFDFRIWLGWNATHRLIYGGIQVADDAYRGFDDAVRADGLLFYLDGDHSGGEYAFLEEDHLNLRQAQAYEVYLDSLNSLGSLFYRNESDWHYRPPYAGADGGVMGENPVFWIIEFYVTPFDLLVWDDLDASVVSSLDAGKVIGLSINITDSDTDGSETDVHVFTVPDELRTADNFIDGLLVGNEVLVIDDSAVESVSWARIKAALKY